MRLVMNLGWSNFRWFNIVVIGTIKNGWFKKDCWFAVNVISVDLRFAMDKVLMDRWFSFDVKDMNVWREIIVMIGR
jgi:hypothetical protein